MVEHRPRRPGLIAQKVMEVASGLDKMISDEKTKKFD